MSDIKTGKVKILLVEDNLAHAELTKRGLIDAVLESEIFHVEDGQEALDYLLGRGIYSNRKQYPLPEIILLDLRLQKIHGHEVLSQIKEDKMLKGIPVVILTTSNSKDDVMMAYKNHANSYLVKPVTEESFGDLMKNFKSYWFGANYSLALE